MVFAFQQDFALEDAIGYRDCWLQWVQGSMRATPYFWESPCHDTIMLYH
jgi:hypothetical protein